MQGSYPLQSLISNGSGVVVTEKGQPMELGRPSPMQPSLLRPSLATLKERDRNESDRGSRELDGVSNASTDLIILQRASVHPQY